MNVYKDYGSPGSLQSAQKIAKTLNKPVAEIRKELDDVPAIARHQGADHKFRRRKYVCLVFHCWSSDLKDLSSLSEFNRSYKWLIISIDIGSRYVYGRALLNKSAESVKNAFQDIFDEVKRTERVMPRTLIVDKGKEFANAKVKSLMYDNFIKMVFVEDQTKSAHAERVLKTLCNMIYRYFSIEKTLNWVDILPQIISSYNRTHHSAIGMSPESVTYGQADEIFAKTHFETRPQTRAPKFAVGDYVFITKQRKAFSKAYKGKFIAEVFKIERVIRSHPYTYKLIDLLNEPIQGSFYEAELRATKLPEYYEIEQVLKTRKRKGKVEHFVKFLNYGPKFNAWVSL